MITRSSGFTLVELLVVIAIVGILSAIGVVMYDGYIGTSKRSAATNTMQSVSLAQSEYFSNMGTFYYSSASGADCTPSEVTSSGIETNLFDGADIITDESDFDMCVALSAPDSARNESDEEIDDNEVGYVILASDGADTAPIQMFLNHDGTKGTY